MKTIDYKRELGRLYRQSETEVSLVDVPPFDYLMIDGQGDPNTSPEFGAAVETLYPFSYAIRGLVKEERDVTFVVMPLEGLWWADDVEAFDAVRKNEWKWTVMIMQPEVVTAATVDRARETVREDRDLPALSEVRYASYDEGMSAQTLHVGPYSAEGPTVARLHEFIEEHGYDRRGAHHEIYLNDARRTDPDRLKTIVRQPVER